MSNFRPNAVFVNYFFKLDPDPESGELIPNSGGTLTFYSDTDRSPEGYLATYSNVYHPNNPVVNDNPLKLGADGSAPLIYLQDELYFIEERDSSGAIIRTYEHFYYPYTGSGGGGGGGNNSLVNYVPDGQFDFPIDFTKTGNTQGKIYQERTGVAWSWDFLQDGGTTTENFVTYEDVSNEIIDGSPTNQIIVTSQNVQSGEATKDLRVVIGNVNFSQTNELTLLIYAYSQLGGAPIINVRLEKYYGTGGSATDFQDITAFTLDAERKKYFINFTPSDNEGKTIGENSELALRFQIALGQICQVAMTNVLCCNSVGAGTTPSYPVEGIAETAAKVTGDAISNSLATTGLNTNYQPYIYGGNTNIINGSNTGDIFLAVKTATFPWAARCVGTELNVKDYSTNNIPFKRLYTGEPGSIGKTYGGGGELIVTSKDNVATFTLAEGGREKTPYTNGTTGSALTVVQTTPGQRLGVSCALASGTTDTVQITWLTKFTVTVPPPGAAGIVASHDDGAYPTLYLHVGSDGAYGNVGSYFGAYGEDGGQGHGWSPQAPGYFALVDTAVGSPSTNAVTTIQFKQKPDSSYVSRIYAPYGFGYYACFFEWATNPADTYLVGSNLRARPVVSTAGWNEPPQTPGAAVYFSLDGKGGAQFAGSQTVTVNVLSSDSIEQAVKKFIATVDNPFVDTLTVNSLPAASSYFLFSSPTTDYYGWFKVNGAGTDPAVSGRTGIEIDISSTDTTAEVAAIIAQACNDLTFRLPDETNPDHVPYAVPSDCLSGYFIYY